MAKVKVVNQKTLVADIMTVGGVNKENANSIFNIFTRAWNTDRIGTLKAVDSGIAVSRKPAKKKTVTKKAPTKKVVVAPMKTSKKKIVAKKAKNQACVGKIKTKGKKKLKSKKAKITPTVISKKSTQAQAQAKA